MDFNLATTVSLCSAATCASLAVLGAYLGRAPASRRFRYAALAGLAGALYCMTNAMLAGRLGAGPTAWAGRLSIVLAVAHGAAWLSFLAAWDGRRLSRVERTVITLGGVASLVGLFPGVAVVEPFTERTVGWAGVTYHDPGIGPLALPVIGIIYVEQVLAAVAALRMSARNPRSRVVAAALGIFCVVMLVDVTSGMHWIDLPYLVDPALALVFLSIGSVVMLDAAESAAKSAELERARASLAEGENLAALGQLAAVVAHEVRNPLAIIYGALATLRRGAHGEDDTKLLGIVGEEAERLKQLVTRLLDAVRPFELQYTRRPVEEIVRSAIGQVTSSAGAEPALVELDCALSEEVECDEILLGQAISNLVQNALLATGRRSPVRVRASVERAEQILRIEISDDGDGVAVEARPRLFTPFFTTRATGTGLGLALVRRIAAAHGGSVDYEPRSGGGASFVLRIPLRPERGPYGDAGEAA